LECADKSAHSKEAALKTAQTFHTLLSPPVSKAEIEGGSRPGRQSGDRTMAKEPRTYESEVLSVIACEFSSADQMESERKLKRRLREKRLGPYDQERIAALRAFKEDVQRELAQDDRSAYFTGRHGRYVDMQDWDVAKIAQVMKARHPGVPETEIKGFLPYAILLYYLK
jgi:hypothetical protein